jgi:small subunit ribosomal protein S9
MAEIEKKSTTKKKAAPLKTAQAKKNTVAKKTPPKKKVAVKPKVTAPKVASSVGEYWYGLGRRKTATAQVRVFKKGTGKITVNGSEYAKYFPHFELQEIVRGPLTTVGQLDSVDISIKVSGGGMRGQADAARLGIARALLGQNETYRAGLKANGFLKRDPRKKERKKPGLRKARRAPQWSKR